MAADPVAYAPDAEDVQSDQANTVAGLNEAFDIFLKTTAEDYQHAARSVHVKSSYAARLRSS